MKPLRPLLLCSVMTLMLHAQHQDTVLLWPSTPELNSPKGMGKDVSKRGKRFLVGVKTPHLRIYEAPKSHAPTPAVLLSPGGGYSQLATSVHEPIASWLQKQGIRPFLLAYRCPSDRKNPVGPEQDIQRAIRLLRANAAEWNIDPNRIGVLGSSAGGNLAVRASVSSVKNTYPPRDAADELNSKPNFTILLYPAWVGNRKTGETGYWIELRSDFGPTFITSAKDDKHHRSGVIYGNSLKEAGLPVKELYFEKGGHAFSLREPASIATWPEACLVFLKQEGILN